MGPTVLNAPTLTFEHPKPGGCEPEACPTRSTSVHDPERCYCDEPGDNTEARQFRREWQLFQHVAGVNGEHAIRQWPPRFGDRLGRRNPQRREEAGEEEQGWEAIGHLMQFDTGFGDRVP